jgi:hypothetical protein
MSSRDKLQAALLRIYGDDPQAAIEQAYHDMIRISLDIDWEDDVRPEGYIVLAFLTDYFGAEYVSELAADFEENVADVTDLRNMPCQGGVQ